MLCAIVLPPKVPFGKSKQPLIGDSRCRQSLTSILRRIAMAYKTALRLTAIISGLLGLLALIFIGGLYQLFSQTAIVFPSEGAVNDSSLSVWTTLSFLRLTSSFLLFLALVIWELGDIEGADIQRRICRALSFGFALILIVAFIQQMAIWAPAAWSIVVLLLIATISHYVLSLAPKTVSSQGGGKTTVA
jgi:hypothetical protein